jgi:hypothetical protein
MFRLGAHLREYSVRLAVSADEVRISGCSSPISTISRSAKVHRCVRPKARDPTQRLARGKKYDDKFVYVIFDTDNAVAPIQMTKPGFSVFSLWHPEVVTWASEPDYFMQSLRR